MNTYNWVCITEREQA